MYYIMKPFENDMILRRIHQVTEKQMLQPVHQIKGRTVEYVSEYREKNLEADVTNVIHEIGVPAQLMWQRARRHIMCRWILRSFAAASWNI